MTAQALPPPEPPAPRVGDRVRIERDETRYPSKGTWPQFRGRIGTVVETNLGEWGVVFGKASPRKDRPGVYNSSGPVTWFRDYEIHPVGSESAAGTPQELSPVLPPHLDPERHQNRGGDGSAVHPQVGPE